MFVQELLSDINKHLLINESLYNFSIQESSRLVKIAHKFHIGDFDDIYDMFKSREGKLLFVDDSEYLKLPYKTIYIEGTVKRYEGIDAVPKRAMVVQKLNEKLWIYYGFGYLPRIKRWILNPISFIFHIGSQIMISEILEQMRKIIPDDTFNVLPPDLQYKLKEKVDHISRFDNQKTAILPCILLKNNINEEYVQSSLQEETFDLTTLSNFIMLLNCKNVSTNQIKVYQSAKKKGQGGYGGRKIELPTYNYHILKLKLPKEIDKQNIDNHNEAMKHYRKHFCRGHFKTYTEGKPLLGHGIGRYWFSAHLRGSEDGFVDKDYEIQLTK